MFDLAARLALSLLFGLVVFLLLHQLDAWAARFRDRDKPLLPAPNHLSCGQCLWLLPAAFPENRSPDSLCDQLIISPFCEVHNTFAWKRWNEKHLDDKGLKNPWQTDVDNYRGFLED